MRTKKSKEWLFATQAGAILDVHPHKVPEIALAGGIRKRKLPGETIVRYNADDCRRVARESVIDPNAQQEKGLGTVAASREEEDGPRQLLVGKTRAASAKPTEAGVLTR